MSIRKSYMPCSRRAYLPHRLEEQRNVKRPHRPLQHDHVLVAEHCALQELQQHCEVGGDNRNHEQTRERNLHIQAVENKGPMQRHDGGGGSKRCRPLLRLLTAAARRPKLLLFF